MLSGRCSCNASSPECLGTELDNFYTLKKGDCTHYPTGWKYKVANTGDSPGKFLWYMTSPPGIQQRLDKSK